MQAEVNAQLARRQLISTMTLKQSQSDVEPLAARSKIIAKQVAHNA